MPTSWSSTEHNNTGTDLKRPSTTSEQVVRSAGVTSAAIATSRVTGLIREKLMAHFFGAGLDNDAFQLGFRIPNLTRDLFAEGALSSAFVPIFTEYLAKRSKEEARTLYHLTATALVIIVGIICVLGSIFAPVLVSILAPGFHHIPKKFELAVTMTRIMFPFLLLVALAAQVMGVLNACGIFGVPALASTMFNIGSMGFGLFMGFIIGPHIGITAIEGMACGVVMGGALQLAWQIPSLHRMGFSFRPAINWKDTGLRRIFSMMGPAIIGNAAVQVNVAINTNFATSLTDAVRGSDGPVSWLSYAFRFMHLPLGLFGVAMATATLSSISRSAAQGNFDEFRQTLSRSLSAVFLMTIPSSVGLIVLGQSIIGAIFQGGNFKLYDAQQTAAALSFFAIGLLGYAGVKVLTPAFYALNDSRTPMLVSLSSVLINYLACSVMIHYVGLGHTGLALSTSVVTLFTFLAQFTILRARLGGMYGRDLVASVLKVLVASMVMGLVIAGCNAFFENWFGQTHKMYLANILFTMPVGLGVFYLAAKKIEVPELDNVFKALAGPFLRRLKRRKQ